MTSVNKPLKKYNYKHTSAPNNLQLWVYYAQILILTEIHVSSWRTHILKAIEIVHSHLAHQWNQIGKVQKAKLCLPNHIPVHDADWFKRHFRHLYFKADWSEILSLSRLLLPFYAFCFHFGWKHVAFT